MTCIGHWYQPSLGPSNITKAFQKQNISGTSGKMYNYTHVLT